MCVCVFTYALYVPVSRGKVLEVDYTSDYVVTALQYEQAVTSELVPVVEET